MTKNLSFTLGDPADSAAKIPAAQQRSLAEAVGNREVSELWRPEPVVPGLALLGKLQLN